MNSLNAQQSLLELLDNAPLKPVHFWLWALSSGGTLLDGFSIFSLGVAMPLIVRELEIGPDQVGLVGAAIMLGAIFGAACGGPAADRFGRKKLLLADMAITLLGGAISACAGDWELLFAGQLLVGMGIGIDFPVGAAYVSETMPKLHRSRMMVATIACQSIGMLLAAGLTTLLLLRATDGGVWRGFLAATSVIALMLLALRTWMPEAARWLMAQGHNADAARVIARILPEDRQLAESLADAAGHLSQSRFKTDGGRAKLLLSRFRASLRLGRSLALPSFETGSHHAALVGSRPAELGYSALFRPEYRRRTILVSVPWFLMDVATYGVGMFTPVILGAMHLSGRASGAIATDFIDARGSAAIDLFLLVGFLFSLWAVPRFGRIPMQIIGFGGMAVGMTILLLGIQLPGGANQHLPLIFLGFIAFNLLMNAGPNATTFTLAPELFPTQLRASAAGFAAGVAKVGATLGVFALPILKSHYGIATVLELMIAVSIAGLIVTVLTAHHIVEGTPLESRHVKPADSGGT